MNDLVSVIIPVGPKHIDLVIEAVRSVALQTHDAHEIILVNTSGQALPPLPHTTLDSPRNNISLARNLGLDAAAGRFVLFLDADDLLPPDALRILVDAYHTFHASYVYGDWYNVYEDGSASYGHALTKDKLLLGGIHPVSALVPTAIARAVGGFSEQYAGRWEDWEFWLRLAANGHCGERVPQATLLYRRWTGSSFLTAVGEGDALIQELQNHYRPYLTGGAAMGCCGGGKRSANPVQSQGVMTMGVNDTPPTTTSGMVIMEYTGLKRGSFTRIVNSNRYAVGANRNNRYAEVHAADVPRLLAFGDMRVVTLGAPVDVAAVMASVKKEAQLKSDMERVEGRENAEREWIAELQATVAASDSAPETAPTADPEPAPAPPIPADEAEFDPGAVPPPPDPERLAQMQASLKGHEQAVLTNTVAPGQAVQAIRPKGRR